MTWARLDDAFPDHPKVDSLTDGAFRLHVAALCWCCRYLTDGYVAADRVSRLTPRYKPSQVVELVAAHLWEEVDGGWMIHDFLTYQPSARKVQAEREAAAERMRKRRTDDACSPEQTANVRPNERENFGRSFAFPVPSRPKEVLVSGSLGATPAASPASDEGFDAFWDSYPKRNGKRIGKAEAVRVWQRMSRPERAAALLGVEHYRDACEAPDGQLAMDAHRWLTKKRWVDWQTPAVPSSRANGSRSAVLSRPGKPPLVESMMRMAAGNGQHQLPEVT